MGIEVNKSDENQLLLAEEVAEELRASVESVRRWVRLGALRAVQVGGRRLVTRAEVDRVKVEGLDLTQKEPDAA